MLLTSAIISGLGLGSMYGLIALGFHVTYVVSNTVNFSQGSAMMLGAVLGYTFARHASAGRCRWRRMPRSPPARCSALVVERTLVRPFAERGSNAWLMATVAGGIVLDNAGAVHLRQGAARLSLRARAASRSQIFGAGVYPLQLVIPVVGHRRSRSLLQLVFSPHPPGQGAARGGAEPRRRAADGHQRAARASPCRSCSPPRSPGLAGLLIAPLFSVHSDMGTLFGIKAFAVAILGGITRPRA